MKHCSTIRSVCRASASLALFLIISISFSISSAAAQDKLVVISHKVHQIVSTEGSEGDITQSWTEKTGVEVEWQTLPTAPLHERMFREASLSSTQVGVAFLLNTQAVPRNLKLFEPLDDWMAKEPLEDFDDIFPGMVAAMKSGDKLYGVPFRHATSGMHLNMELLAERGLSEPPATMEQWVEYVKQMSFTRDDGTRVYGFILPGGGPRIYPTTVGIARAFDGDFITLDYKVAANQPGMVTAIDILKELYDAGALPKVFTALRGEETNTWVQTGRVAMTLASFGRTRFYNDPKNSKYPGKFNVYPIPVSETLQDKYEVAPVNVEFWAMTIPANYPNKELAWSFVRHMASKQSTLSAALNGNGPVRSSAYDDPRLVEKLPYAKDEQRVLKVARVPLPAFDNASKAMDIFAEEVESVLLGYKSSQEAMDEVVRRVEPLLPKSN